MSDGGDIQDRLEGVIVHVLYCPDCRAEVGRWSEREQAEEKQYFHHTGTGCDPQIISGVYDAAE